MDALPPKPPTERVIQREEAERVLLAAAKLQQESYDRVSVDDIEQMARDAGIEPHHVRTVLTSLSQREVTRVAKLAKKEPEGPFQVGLSQLVFAGISMSSYLLMFTHHERSLEAVVIALGAGLLTGVISDPSRKSSKDATLLMALTAFLSAIVWIVILSDTLSLERRDEYFIKTALVLALQIGLVNLLLWIRRLIVGAKSGAPMPTSRMEAV